MARSNSLRDRKERQEKAAKKSDKPSNAVGKAFAKTAPRSAGNSSKKQPAAAKEPQYREHERMLSVRLDAELLDALDAYAKRRRNSRAHPYSKSGIIAEALLDYLEAQDRRLTALRDRVKVGR